MELHKYGLKSVCSQLVGILDILNIPKVTVRPIDVAIT